MALTRRDLGATALTALAVLAFFATHESWNVWLIGDSHRWATGAIAILGLGTCALRSRPGKGPITMVLATLGIAALVLVVLSLMTASLTPLSFLTVDIVLLWAVSTYRHALQLSGRPIPH